MAACNRDYSCKYCGEEGTYASIQVHEEACKSVKVTCPKDGCNEKVQRQHIRSHILLSCKQTTVHCNYVHAGCEVKLKRKDMPAHEQDYEAHFKAVLHTISLLRQERKHGEPITFKLTDYRKKKELNELVMSCPSYISPNGYRVAIIVDVNGIKDGEGTHVTVVAAFLRGKYDAQLKWPFTGRIVFTLLNQLEDNNHHQVGATLTAAKNIQVGHDLGKSMFIAHSALGYDAVNNTQYLKDDTLYFKMSVESADYKPWLQ